MILTDRKLAEAFELLFNRMDGLERMAGLQRDALAQLTDTLEDVRSRLAQLEARQQAALKSDSVGGKVKSVLKPRGLPAMLKYYGGVAEAFGQLLQVLADSITRIIELIYTEKHARGTLGASRGGPDAKLDLTDLARAAEKLLRELSGRRGTEGVPAKAD